jgi:Cu(I)/Ag(I) efflux system protein CusF
MIFLLHLQDTREFRSMRKPLTLIAALAATTLALAQAPMANGEVTKLDKANARITLKHGEIKSLDMPPMTMTYRVRSPQLLEGVAVGDRVRFTAERIDGNYTVTALSKAP